MVVEEENVTVLNSLYLTIFHDGKPPGKGIIEQTWNKQVKELYGYKEEEHSN